MRLTSLAYAAAVAAMLAAAFGCQPPEGDGDASTKQTPAPASPSTPAAPPAPAAPVVPAATPEAATTTTPGDSEPATVAGPTTPASGTEPTTAIGQLLVANDLSELKLASALSVEIPAAILGTGERVTATQSGKVELALPLVEDAKSVEACQFRRQVKAATRELRAVAKGLCYVEQDVGAQPFGKAYQIAGNDGAPHVKTAKTEGEIKIELCVGGELVSSFRITGTKDGASKGSYLRRETSEDGESTQVVAGTFDLGFTTAGTTTVETKLYRANAGGEDRERAKLRLVDAGVSELAFSTGTSHVLTRAAKVGQHLGQLVEHESGDLSGDGGEPEASIAYRAGFDAAGFPVALSASPFFAPTGVLFVDARQLLKPLPMSEAAPSLTAVAGAWNCQGAEAVTSAGTQAGYEACDALAAGFDDEDCSVAGYVAQSGGEAVADGALVGD